MKAFKVEIIRFADNSQPGFIEARFKDAWDIEHVVIDKVPVLTLEDLDENSDYPKEGVVACEILKKWEDANGRTILTIDTEKPWGIYTIEELTRFDLLEEKLVED
ncbi:hypothetical protein [Emticicia sp. C21]|uniref:hypothetical protein n=1 Tax=Emticicia sp. C21 TaxID=2302915 RepID=UPI000E3490E4|nr:hypothetical protein [Emticicia sp. C21]RFS14450.1 hypothetical protein D0T08_21500 [Emticicia sp. C21]